MSRVDPSKLCQIEFWVRDRKAAEEFYLNALGWKTVPVEILNYSLLEVPEQCPFGIALVSAPGASGGSSPTVHFAVDDLAAVAERVNQAGGKVVGQPRPIPGGGKTQVIEDLDGNRLGIYQPN
jgi:predicted enzyme related to lactoylglutathione lyase